MSKKILSDPVRIPYVLTRGGTSNGPYLLASLLPIGAALPDSVLIAALGVGPLLEIDGIGSRPFISKVAIVSRSECPCADADYLSTKVKVEERAVGTSPNCGDMLADVGAFATQVGEQERRRL